MTAPGQIRCHLLWESDDAWDLEQSLFSLVGQRGSRLVVCVRCPESLRSRAEEACARLGPLSTTVALTVASGGAPMTTADDDAVTLWSAGTLGTPDHFARVLGALLGGATVVVAAARRMRLSRQPDAPPWVVRKTWLWTPRHPSYAAVVADPAFLGRCVVRRDAAPQQLPLGRTEQLAWARRLWAGTRPVRVEGLPSIDLPDLRPEGAATRLGDGWADLRYQLPRRFERAAPLAFTRARRWFHALRALSGGGRG